MISENSCPDLYPLNFSREEIASAVDNNKMLAMQAHLPAVCNYQCYYCYTRHMFQNDKYMLQNVSIDSYKKFIKQGKELGAKSISFPGLGEPLLIPWFAEILKYCKELLIDVVFFTNGSLIDKYIDLLFEFKPALYIKLNSLSNDHVMESMCNAKNARTKALSSILKLKSMGYQNDGEYRIGVETVVLKENYNCISEIYQWCRENSFIPLIELPMPFINSEIRDEILVSDSQAIDLFNQLSAIDKRYNFIWQPIPPFAGTGCSFHLISLCLFPDGSIHPCSGIELDEPYGDINKKDLVQIWNSHIVKEKNKIINEMKCINPLNNYGCRAYAFRKHGSIYSPDERINSTNFANR